MAELKYDLLLVSTKTDKKIYSQPWYKERLRTKYIKSLGPQDTSKFLAGRNWTFLKDGLDDFRDGLPPPTENEMIKGEKGLGPNIKGSSDDIAAVKQPAARRRFNKDEICFSRVTPLQQQRRDHIEEIEYGLTQHPLALYPHLEECLPPDVFEDVVDILDPEMNLASDEEDEDEFDDDFHTESQDRSSDKGPATTIRPPGTAEEEEDEEENKVRNPYRWLPKKDEKEKDKKDKRKGGDKRPSSPSENEHIHSVTKDFCDWVASLGGESNNIEESTITSLFASGYETKPALSVPIHVVELTNVPPELRQSAAVPQQSQQQKNLPTNDSKQGDWKHSGEYEPSWVKFKYGAWYLPPKMWKRRPEEEALQDPKELKDQEMSEAKKKGNELDYQLAPMHGSKAFIDFIDKKSTRKPEFLQRVGDIQEQQARDEQARIEAEHAKQKKLQGRRRVAPTIQTEKKE